MNIETFFLWRNSPPVGQGLLIIEVSPSLWDTPRLVGLIWTSDHPDAETSTWQHTTLTAPSIQFEPAILASQRPQTHVLDRAATEIGNADILLIQDRILSYKPRTTHRNLSGLKGQIRKPQAKYASPSCCLTFYKRNARTNKYIHSTDSICCVHFRQMTSQTLNYVTPALSALFRVFETSCHSTLYHLSYWNYSQTVIRNGISEYRCDIFGILLGKVPLKQTISFRIGGRVIVLLVLKSRRYMATPRLL
jgi:hypothetical protein